VFRFIVTVKDALWPGASVSVLGLTVTSTPSRPVTRAVYVAACEPTLVTSRVTVRGPSSLPMAIDGMLRSVGSME
jgi:hypothetical protein